MKLHYYVVNFPKILWAHLHQYSCTLKSSNLKCKYCTTKQDTKLSYKKAAHKMLLKLTIDTRKTNKFSFRGQIIRYTFWHFSDNPPPPPVWHFSIFDDCFFGSNWVEILNELKRKYFLRSEKKIPFHFSH